MNWNSRVFFVLLIAFLVFTISAGYATQWISLFSTPQKGA